MNTLATAERLISALQGIDEMCQAGLNSSDPKHWEAALQDVMRDAREALRSGPCSAQLES